MLCGNVTPLLCSFVAFPRQRASGGYHQFAKLKALTQDENVLKEALENSTVVSIIDDRIKSLAKPSGRSTIILRDIPSDTPVEEVRQIFEFDGAKPLGSIRSDIGDTW